MNLPNKNCQDGKDLNANHEGCSKRINELIDHKCKQLSKTKTGKGSAMHLAEWMKGQLGNSKEDILNNSEVWMQEDASKTISLSNRPETRCEEDFFLERSIPQNTERNHQSLSTSESQSTIKSNQQEKTVSVCRECHKTCLNSEEKHGFRLHEEDIEEEEDCDNTWGSLMMLGMCGIMPSTMKSLKDPFAPAEPPSISVLPPTPDKKIKNTNVETGVNYSSHSKCNSFSNVSNCSDKNSDGSREAKVSPVPTPRKTLVRSADLTETDDDDTAEELVSDELPYKTLPSPGLRRFGTLNSLERVSSDDPLDQDDQADETGDSDKEEEEEEEKFEVKSHPPEVGDSIRGWTMRAGSFVAAKMAFFERISSPDNSVTVRKTTFLESRLEFCLVPTTDFESFRKANLFLRYLKPSGENHLDSSPDPGANTPSSGRGEDEGETSGATSGEEVWGTPTSGGEFEEEFVGDGSVLSFVESPRGSIGTDDDTEQLMEDLLISLPMLAARTHGVPPRRRLEPLLEEDDTESSSAPCSPKPLHENKTGQGRGLTGSLPQQHENSPNPGRAVAKDSSVKKDTVGRARIGTIDRALGIHSDDEEESLESVATSPSLLRRFGLRRSVNREDCGKKGSRLLSFLSSRKEETSFSNRNSATYGAKPLFRYLFNKDSDDDIPTSMPKNFSSPRKNEKQLERRFWKQLKRRRSSTPTGTAAPATVLQSTSQQIAV